MQYVGMTSRNPYIRKQEWENKGRQISNFVIIQTGLTYEEAEALETSYRKNHNHQVEGNEGGQKKPGPVYSVYVYEYS